MAAEQERVKNSLQTRLHDAVKQCQIRFGGKRELATTGESCIACLCSAWEAVLHHGLRRPPKTNIPSSLKQVSELTGLSRLLMDDLEETTFWRLIVNVLPPDERQRFHHLSSISTDTGRFRAWLRAALNEHSLERQVQTLLANDNLIRQYYLPNAFMMDAERTALLPPLAAGVNSIVFALEINQASLNSPLKTVYTVAPSSANSLGSSGNRFFAQLAGSANGSFDSVDDDAIVAVEVAPPLQKAPRRRRVGPRSIGHPKVTPDGAAVSDTVSVRSEELSTTASAHNDAKIHKRTSSDQMLGWRILIASTGDRPSSRSTSLTSDSIEEAEEARQSWTEEPPRFPVLEGSTGTPELEETDHQPEVFDEGPGSRSDGDGGIESPTQTAGSLSVEEMRKMMLAVIDNKDAVEEENRQLTMVLDEYKTKLGSAENALQLLETQAAVQEERNRSVIDDLLRENTIVKQQLREYVHSVELMGSHSSDTQNEKSETDEGEEKAMLVSGVPEDREAFQTKLVQLAQMQGELLELNERLQRTIKEKDNVITRLRNELTHLRGPLPDQTTVSSEMEQSPNSRRWNPFNQPLVHLWIPTAMLQRRNGVAHHVYQVYIRIGDSEEWNVYRRYADFRRLHSTLRKTYTAIDRFEFPPKLIKNMKEKVVEERRVKLQSYMRLVINHIVECHPQQNISKSFLLQFLSILDDSK